MIFTIPKSDKHSQVKITVRTSRGPTWGFETWQDDSLKTFKLDIPQDINVDDVEVFCEYVGGDGKVDHTVSSVVLKTMKRPKLPPRTNHARS